VLVDTPVWSLALRRTKRVDHTAIRELGELIQEGRVVLMGAVRQELLSGIKLEAQFELLRGHLRAFPDLELDEMDYEEAASAYNRCRGRGVQGSNTDFLICAAASRRDLAIYTTDRDFQQYAKVLDLQLHSPRRP
jgi:hypothetical protein